MEWSEEKKLVAVTLNIGGRSTNPLEFLLDGDETPTYSRLGAFS